MNIEDLVQDVASDVTDGDAKKIGIILLFVIEQLIALAIQWFFNKYVTEQQAQSEFRNYFNNMNFLKKIQWSLRAYKVTKQHKNLDVSNDKLAGSLSCRFGNLSEADVESLFSQYKNLTRTLG